MNLAFSVTPLSGEEGSRRPRPRVGINVSAGLASTTWLLSVPEAEELARKLLEAARDATAKPPGAGEDLF